MNKLSRAEPHKGYQHLKNIISLANKEDKHWVYHSGVDSLYTQNGFKNLVNAKGCLFDWLCKKCGKLVTVKPKEFELDRIRGFAENIPSFSECGRIMRPNINMRGDFDWNEKKFNEQSKGLEDFLQRPDIKKHSVTVLEIGAGPVQPLAREFAEQFLKNDRVRCCLIRINPNKERTS